MKLTDSVLLLVCLLSGAAVAANLLGRDPSAAPLPPAPAPDSKEEIDRAERLRDEIRVVRARVADLESRKLVASKTPDPAPGDCDSATPEAPPSLPDRLVREAARLGVPEELAAAAWEHFWRTQQRKGASKAAADRLATAGEDGFRAVIALIRAGHRATWNQALLESCYEPGLERHLMDLADDPEAGPARASGFRYLAIADTPEVRDFLVDHAHRETEAAVLWYIAEALGDLHEPRGAAQIEGRFTGPDWAGVRPHILYAIGKMGGEDAKRILVAHLRHPHGDALNYAIAALALVDRDVARAEAQRILDGPRAEHLDGVVLSALERAAIVPTGSK